MEASQHGISLGVLAACRSLGPHACFAGGCGVFRAVVYGRLGAPTRPRGRDGQRTNGTRLSRRWRPTPRSLGHASQFLAKNNMQPRQIAKLTKVRAAVAASEPLTVATTAIAGAFGCLAASQQRRLPRNTGTPDRVRVGTE